MFGVSVPFTLVPDLGLSIVAPRSAVSDDRVTPLASASGDDDRPDVAQHQVSIVADMAMAPSGRRLVSSPEHLCSERSGVLVEIQSLSVSMALFN